MNDIKQYNQLCDVLSLYLLKKIKFQQLYRDNQWRIQEFQNRLGAIQVR